MKLAREASSSSQLVELASSCKRGISERLYSALSLLSGRPTIIEKIITDMNEHIRMG